MTATLELFEVTGDFRAVVAPATENPGRIQEYLVAHQTYAPGLNPQGGARYIRTVAVAEASPR